MPNIVAPTDLTAASDAHLLHAFESADDGVVVVVAVLSGSLVDRALDPGEAGRVRRHHEDQAVEEARAQMARLGMDARFEVVALFGDVAFDTLLLAQNLGADAVVARAGDPATDEMERTASIPVIAIG